MQGPETGRRSRDDEVDVGARAHLEVVVETRESAVERVMEGTTTLREINKVTFVE